MSTFSSRKSLQKSICAIAIVGSIALPLSPVHADNNPQPTAVVAAEQNQVPPPLIGALRLHSSPILAPRMR